MATKPSVGVVDDDESVRVALRRLLNIAGFEVTTFCSAKDFVDSSRGSVPPCLVVDQRMPQLNGLEFQRLMNQGQSVTSIVFITGYADVRTSVEAMKAGAVDFLLKPVEEEALIAAVNRGLGRTAEMAAARHERAVFLEHWGRLTPRERDVARLVARGLLNKQIAWELGTAEKTVKVHRGRLMRKLAVGSAAELARIIERTEPFEPAPTPSHSASA